MFFILARQAFLRLFGHCIKKDVPIAGRIQPKEHGCLCRIYFRFRGLFLLFPPPAPVLLDEEAMNAISQKVDIACGRNFDRMTVFFEDEFRKLQTHRVPPPIPNSASASGGKSSRKKPRKEEKSKDDSVDSASELCSGMDENGVMH